MSNEDDIPHDAEGHLALPSIEALRALRGESQVPATLRTPKGTRKQGRRRKPMSRPEDRQYVANSIRHWRKTHDLTVEQASARIGYGITGNAWRTWEKGTAAPPYETLLRIIAATGLGYWVDHDRRRDVDPTLRHTIEVEKVRPN